MRLSIKSKLVERDVPRAEIVQKSYELRVSYSELKFRISAFCMERPARSAFLNYSSLVTYNPTFGFHSVYRQEAGGQPVVRVPICNEL